MRRYQQRDKLFGIILSTVLLFGLLTGGVFAATAPPPEHHHDMNLMPAGGHEMHDMNQMKNTESTSTGSAPSVQAPDAHSIQDGHNTNSMPAGSHPGHDMNASSSNPPSPQLPDSHSGHDSPSATHPGGTHEHEDTTNSAIDTWPILYGFGGVSLAVVLVAGVLKYTGMRQNGGK